MKPIIKVENLSKQYTIGGAKEPYSTFRESLISAARKPIDKFKNRGKENGDNRFWALKDINLEVMPGEVVGIIGRNGAGKSTLLKILSRITEPTKGRVELYGRVGSLLEVGTGFHPELTGRENIYLNGAILGMHRGEIAKKFDEIVDFAEVEDFLDTPVKRYSSGMYMKLAFAVAASLDPEILVVDEVLAVGDAQFQKKCLGKMKEVAGLGKTVLFVSHNMRSVTSLCSRGILLKDGEKVKEGGIQKLVREYLSLGEKDSSYSSEDDNRALTQILWAKILNKDGENRSQFSYDEPIRLKFGIKNFSSENGLLCAICVLDLTDQILTVDCVDIESKTGYVTLDFILPSCFFVPNRLKFSIALFIPNKRIVQIVDEHLRFEIIDANFELSKYGKIETGIVRSKAVLSILKH